MYVDTHNFTYTYIWIFFFFTYKSISFPEPPGKVTGLKATETSYTHLTLTWTTPKEKAGIQDEAKGYFVEVRHADCIEWSRCNGSAITTTSFTVRGLRSMEMYWVRVIATNDGGEGAPQELSNYIIAMPSPGTLFLRRMALHRPDRLKIHITLLLFFCCSF